MPAPDRSIHAGRAAVLAVAVWAGAVPPAGSQDRPGGMPALFTKFDRVSDSNRLTPKQLNQIDERVKAIRAEPATEAIHLVTFDPEPLRGKAAGPVWLVDPGAAKHLGARLVGFTTKTGDKGATTLDWVPEGWRESGESVVLSARGKLAVGVADLGGKSFDIRPLGHGVHAVVEVDGRRFPPDHVLDRTEAKPEPIPARPGPFELRVLVAYTPAVVAAQPGETDEERVGVVLSALDTAVKEANISYQWSDINLRMTLAHAYRTNFAETANQKADLEKFKQPADGVMDEAHALRKQHQADVCLLVVATPGASPAAGEAYRIGATRDTAFALVHWKALGAQRSLPHEVGHLQGARHDPAHDDPAEPGGFPFGHGFVSRTGAWMTVMAEGAPQRVKMWSNPNKVFRNEALGDATTRDNARVLNTTAPLVTSFRP